MVSIDQIKQLRQETGISISECKKALEEAGGDIEQAKIVLRKLGKKMSEKKAEREIKEGIVEAYIHPNKKLGVLTVLGCESDFVARSNDFQNLAHEICLQVAAMKPTYLSGEDIPKEIIEEEKKIYEEQLRDSDKPEEIKQKIIESKIQKFREENSLLSQAWIKDNTKTIKDLINDYIAKLGENITVKKFGRYEI